MVEVIPSINAATFPDIQERIKKIEPFVSWCHIDVTDGKFSEHPTWNAPEDFAGFKTSLNVEVHLMIKNPDDVLRYWLVPQVRRLIVHLEAAEDPAGMLVLCKHHGIQLGFAVRPETPWERFIPWFGKADLFQILAVDPGPSGQAMEESILDKIIHLREACPGCTIEVDGGVNLMTARKAKECGADILVSGSHIFRSDDIGKAIGKLREVDGA